MQCLPKDAPLTIYLVGDGLFGLGAGAAPCASPLNAYPPEREPVPQEIGR